MRILILLLIFCATAAQASGPRVETTQKATQTGGNMDSIGIGGSDYDIGNGVCRVHVGGLTFAFALRDKVCEGVNLIRVGAVKGGITHLCKQSAIRDNYPSFEDCWDELSEVYPSQPAMAETASEEQEVHEQQEQLYLDLRQELQELKEQQPKVVYRVDPQLQRQLDEDQARRQKAREALKGADK